VGVGVDAFLAGEDEVDFEPSRLCDKVSMAVESTTRTVCIVPSTPSNVMAFKAPEKFVTGIANPDLTQGRTVYLSCGMSTAKH
jgi:hypothetical protein